MPYKILSTTANGIAYQFGEVTASNMTPSGYAMQVNTHVMSCCGLGAISGFSNYTWSGYTAETLFAQEAAWLEGFYDAYKVPGHFVYVLTDTQLGKRTPQYGGSTVPKIHELFLKLGAKEIAVFPNLTHGPSMLHMFLVNIQNAVGPYLDKTGKALKAPPAPPAPPELPVVAPPPKPARKPRAVKEKAE